VNAFYITPERYGSFAFTNPFDNTDISALYFDTPPMNLIRFDSLTANIEWSVYALFGGVVFVLVLLYELVEYIRPVASDMNWWPVCPLYDQS
jgi:hypothetical protein